MHFLFVFLLLTGCKTTSVYFDKNSPSNNNHKYNVGDCLMIVDLPNGETKSRHRVRIEKIANNRYYYRWYLENKWDTELSTGAGDFKILEKISKRVNDCP